MNMLRIYFAIICLFTVICFAVCQEGYAATYYIDSVNGNDSGSGTSTSPWKTLVKAGSSTVKAGDTVLFKAGVYTGTLAPVNSGTAGNLITFKPDAGLACQGGFGQTKVPGSCKIDGQGASGTAVNLAGKQYIRIEGFEITNYTDTGVEFSAGTSMPPKVSGCEIVNNYIHEIGNPGTNYSDTYDLSKAISGNYSRGVLIENNETYRIGGYSMWIGECVDVVVRGNTAHYCGHDGFAVANQQDPVNYPSNIIIEYNRLYDSCHTSAHQDAMQLWGAYDGMIIRYNTVSDFTQLTYISNPSSDSDTYGAPWIKNVQIYGNVYFNDKYWRVEQSETQGIFIDGRGNRHAGVRNISIHSNTFGWTGYGGIWIFDEDIDGVKIENNIFYGGISIDPSAKNVSSDYNLYYNAPAYDIPANEGSHSIKTTVDPQFINYTGQNSTAFDFHLKSTSPAIDRGDPQLGSQVTLPSSFKDIDGNVRPFDVAGVGTNGAGAFDMGAYEYGSSSGGGSNLPPTANAGPDQTVTDTDNNGVQSVVLNGSGSSDSDGSITSYVWKEGGTQIATGVSPTVTLAVGIHTITLIVTDNGGLTATDTVVITVNAPVADKTPPSILSVTASESSVEIQFNEALDGASAGSAGNYSISDGLTINSVWLDTGYNRATIYTMQTDGKPYTLNVVNVKDAAGNPMAKTSVTYTYNSGLVGYYVFGDAGSSYVADSSGHNNTGYYINGTQRTGQQEANLGGGDDAVQISTTDWNAAQGAVAVWINGTSMLGTQYIFGHSVGSWSNRIQLYIDNGYLGIGLGDTRSLKTNIQLLSTQTWYHIALSWDGTNYTVYVNGLLSATGTYTGLTLLNNLADIGNTGNTTSRTEGFQGLIDEVRIYNRALTAAEISNLALVFLPIGDKIVAEGNELSFAIRTIPGVTMTLADSNLPGLPSFASNTFRWTPGYTNAGTYEVEFTAPHGTSMEDFEKVTITVTDTNLPNNINSPPIGYWKFDETSGNIASDSSASGDTGYLKNGLTWGTGKINGAVVFSVPNDAVEIRTTNFNLQQGTIGMWVYVQKQTLSRHYFFGHITATTNRIQLYDKYGYLCLGLGDSQETSVNIQRLQNKRWYHIVLTWNKPTYNVYVNGALKASGTYSGLTAFADHADIGNNGLGRNMGLNGKIDDAYIYNRVLNADEIIRLYVGN
jgi:Concanavalin A-like lectin/glucanases superfamily/Right handed beta helix region/PKD domain